MFGNRRLLPVWLHFAWYYCIDIISYFLIQYKENWNNQNWIFWKRLMFVNRRLLPVWLHLAWFNCIDIVSYFLIQYWDNSAKRNRSFSLVFCRFIFFILCIVLNRWHISMIILHWYNIIFSNSVQGQLSQTEQKFQSGIL